MNAREKWKMFHNIIIFTYHDKFLLASLACKNLSLELLFFHIIVKKKDNNVCYFYVYVKRTKLGKLLGHESDNMTTLVEKDFLS